MLVVQVQGEIGEMGGDSKRWREMTALTVHTGIIQPHTQRLKLQSHTSIDILFTVLPCHLRAAIDRTS